VARRGEPNVSRPTTQATAAETIAVAAYTPTNFSQSSLVIAPSMLALARDRESARPSRTASYNRGVVLSLLRHRACLGALRHPLLARARRAVSRLRARGRAGALRPVPYPVAGSREELGVLGRP
jgi:hypothetical protein